MVRSGPDYVEYAEKREVVIRPTLISVTGKVFVSEQFDEPDLKWYADGDTGMSADIITDNVFSGSGAIKISAPSGSGEIGGVGRQIPVPESKIVGIECVFATESNYDGTFTIELQRYDATRIVQSGIRWNAETYKWYAYEKLAWTEIAGSTTKLPNYEKAFSRIKFVVDFQTGIYKSLISQHNFVNLSAYTARIASVTTTEMMFLRLRTTNSGGVAARSVYVDNLVVTEEE